MKTLTEQNNFLAIEEKYSNYNNSDIVIVSAPYEHTVTYGGGASAGPNSIIEASHYVEFYDDEFDRELCFEHGIAALPELDFTNCHDQAMLAKIEELTDRLIDDNKFVVILGGEHTIATAPIKSHFKKYPNMSVLHFDAHSDLRDEYLDSKYSHASFMARVCEFFPPERITQVGIRAQCREEADFIKATNIHTFYASAIRRGLHGSYWQQAVADTLADEVYVTFDIDYFDPAIIPATGTPEPDGFSYNETLDIFRILRRQGKRIVGFDLVELAPIKGLHHPNLTAAKLVYKILNISFC